MPTISPPTLVSRQPLETGFFLHTRRCTWCGCGRRLVTGSCVIREKTQTGRPWSRPRVCLSISIYLYLSLSIYLTGRRSGKNERPQCWQGTKAPPCRIVRCEM